MARATPPPPRRKEMPLWQEMPVLLVVAFCLAVLIRTFLMQAFFIPSGSMENTLLVKDRVLVNKMVYDMRGPQRGEVVVFSGTDSWLPEIPPEPNLGLVAKFSRTLGDLVGVTRPGDKDFIKRVIGLPGDRVSCCDPDGRVLVNGVPLDEPYVFENSPLDAPPGGQCRGRRFEEVVVGNGQMFVMGDHRLVSLDGRCQGLVPIDNVIGKAMAVVWPTRNWRVLQTPSTFDAVPDVANAPVRGTAKGTRNAGEFGIVLPLLLTSLVSGRTRRQFSATRRTLLE
ncbi:signal peptidase I [Pilimelia terevasa]|uniref:signal peptidase I n=1 Tax=Pilimelia terevasa TaxID=53372 RepID=UPI001E2B4243|nr:signal peptidase I [Pilimelia terevasa]